MKVTFSHKNWKIIISTSPLQLSHSAMRMWGNFIRPPHSCLSEKYRMGAPQWKNAFNTFLHRIIDLSWLFRLYNECWICWWYLVVTQKILVVVIGHFHTSAKLRRLCGQDFSFCGGYAVTKAYSRLDRLHKNAIWGSAHDRAFVIFSGGERRPIGESPKNLYPPYAPRSALKSTFFQSLVVF